MTASLTPLFEPATVAVYGASHRDPRRLGNRLLRNALAGGSAAVVPVHPAGGPIPVGDASQDVTAVASLDRAVDLALISVPAASATAALRDATRAGARTAVVLSSGFGETGPAGHALQDELAAVARAAGTRLVGPNCMGVVSHRGGDAWLDASYFWDVPRQPGRVSFVTQSGAFGGIFLSELRQRGAGMARFVSLGNAADVTVTDALAWLGEDPHTAVIGLFVESVGDGRRLVETARKITPRKPVVAIKAGRSRGGARAAASHTGSIAGSYGPVQAAFLRAGVQAETDTEAFFDRLFAASALGGDSARRIAVITVSGGPGVLAADAVEAVGGALPTLSDATQAALRRLVPDFAPTGNPVDLTPQCRPEVMGAAVRAVFADAAVDGVVLIDCGLDVPELGRAVAAGRAATGKPATAYALDTPDLAEALTCGGVPLFASVERAVRALVGQPRSSRGGPQ